ncbi:MAG: TonB-dependent receptor [Sandarakinorhabdus sp.]|nr:TonB-dependent receptor [Sandarakinorhabdus sp.]
MHHPISNSRFSNVRPLAGIALATAALLLPAHDAAFAEAALAYAAPPEIVVIGSPERLLDISGSGAVVTAQDLQRSRVLSVNDALRQVAGVFPRDEEGTGARPNIGIRGLNPTRSTKVLLLEDGVPLSFAPYGDNASYYHPPIERFERIEVLKGASQVRFGPQTIGGVINYITPRAPDEPTARATLQGGNRDAFAVDAMAGGPMLGGRVLLHANHKQSAGNRDHQMMRFTDLFTKGEWELGASHRLSLKGSWFRERSDVTYSGLTQAEFAANPRDNLFPRGDDTFHTDRISFTAAHGWTMADGLELRTTAYYHHFDRDWWRQSSNSNQRPNDASDPACGGMANLRSGCGNEGRLRVYDTWGIESRATLDHRDFLGLGLDGATEIGLRYHEEKQRRRQLNGDLADSREAGSSVNAGVRENQLRYATALSAFVQSTLDFGRLALIPGVRVETVDFERRNLPVDILAGGRPSGATTAETRGATSLDQFIPGIGATFDLGPAVILYGGLHRGFAPPRVEDVITTGGGSVDLDSELSWNWEAGIRGTIAPGIRADATAFVMDFENQIVPQSVAGGVGAALTSAGQTLHRGGELSLALSSRDAGRTGETDLFARLALTWLATARYASTRIATAPCFDGRPLGSPVETGSGAVPCGVARDIKGNRLPYSPEWLVGGAVGVAHRGFTGQVEVVGQSKMFADDVNLVPVSPDGQRGLIPGWAVVNLAASYGPPEGRWELFATARNLFDRTIIADRSRGITPGMPLTLQAGISLRF